MPKSPMREVRDGVERLVQEGVAAVQGSEAVLVDVYETATHVVVKANIIGAEADAIDVAVTGSTLTIKGETHSDAEVDDSAYLRRERRFGKFERAVHIPGEVDADEAAAGYKGGVLTISIPRTRTEHVQKVEIKGE